MRSTRQSKTAGMPLTYWSAISNARGSMNDGAAVSSIMDCHPTSPAMDLGPPTITRRRPLGRSIGFFWVVEQINGTRFCQSIMTTEIGYRLDRLISILINVYFPFYEHTPQQQSRTNGKLEESLFGGLHRWETDCIQECPSDAVPIESRALFGTTIYCVLPRRRKTGSISRPHYCGRSRIGSRETCTCGYLEQTGKRCVHLWAMMAFELCGPIMAFEENAAIIQDKLLTHRYSDSGREVQQIMDGNDDVIDDDYADFEEYWGEHVSYLENISLFPRDMAQEHREDDNSSKQIPEQNFNSNRASARLPFHDSLPSAEASVMAEREMQHAAAQRTTSILQALPIRLSAPKSTAAVQALSIPPDVAPPDSTSTVQAHPIRRTEVVPNRTPAVQAPTIPQTAASPNPTCTVQAQPIRRTELVPNTVPSVRGVSFRQPAAASEGNRLTLSKPIRPPAAPSHSTTTGVPSQSAHSVHDIRADSRRPEIAVLEGPAHAANLAISRENLTQHPMWPTKSPALTQYGADDSFGDPVRAETSPIGRRYHSLRADANEVTVGEEQEVISQPLPGRLPQTKPLNPRRGRTRQPKKPTTIKAKSRKSLKDRRAPLGAVNTGIDCYALALFHLLFRQDSWLESLDQLLRSQGAKLDAVLRLMTKFRDGLTAKKAPTYPTLFSESSFRSCTLHMLI